MPVTGVMRPASAGTGGVDLGRLLASWARRDAPAVHAALLPLDAAEEAAEALAVSGAAFLVLASGGAAALYSDRPFPPGVARFVQSRRVTRDPAFVGELDGPRAALAALHSFASDPRPLALAGGAWAGLTTATTPEG